VADFQTLWNPKLLLVIIKTMKRAKKTPVDGVFAASN
jgi:hypothetical protein